VVLDVVQRLVERRLPELIMTGIAEHQKVPMTQPRSAALCAGVQIQGFHPTWVMLGHS
jgi:chemotaxis regulatin CheY-phosphate phosphatase CheZ